MQKIVLLVMSMIIALSAAIAVPMPGYPHIFNGDVIIEGKSVKDGVIVFGKIDEKVVGTDKTSDSKYEFTVDNDGTMTGDDVYFFIQGLNGYVIETNISTILDDLTGRTEVNLDITGAENICGDNSCTGTESCSSCEQDCGVCAAPSPPSPPGGGGGPTGGGGGGGGAFYTCNMDWTCTEWSDCVKDVEIRECNFVKVPQHTQSTQCPLADNPPETSRECETPKEVTTSTVESIDKTETEEKNETEPEEVTQKPEGALAAITGAVTRVFANPDAVQELKIAGVVILILLGILVYRVRRKKTNKKE